MSLYVIDTSVFNKLFLDEEGREETLLLFKYASKGEILLTAPHLLYYEVIATAQYYNLPIQTISELLDNQLSNNLKLTEPTKEERTKALEIIQTGHKRSGFPSIYDATFHGMAIVQNGTFVTADKKHYAKAKELGHILLLDELKGIL